MGLEPCLFCSLFYPQHLECVTLLPNKYLLNEQRKETTVFSLLKILKAISSYLADHTWATYQDLFYLSS